MVPFHAGVAAFGGPTIESNRVIQVVCVKQGDFGAGGLSGVGGFLADAEHQAVIEGVQVAAVAGDFELAAHYGVGGVAEVNRVKRVGLAKGHHVAHVAYEAHGVDAFAGAHVAYVADSFEFGAVTF